MLALAYLVPLCDIAMVLLRSLATSSQSDRRANRARSVSNLQAPDLVPFDSFMITDSVGVEARQLIDLIISRADVTRSSSDFGRIARPVFQYVDKRS
jgi:hypothetical protein